MKRKSIQQATANAVIAEPQFSKKQRNLRSKFPRRKRAHISPILFKFSASKPATSLNSTCDDISCNSTLESAVLPSNAPFQHVVEYDVNFKPPPKQGAVEISVSENSCVESCSVIATEAESKPLQIKPTETDVGPSEFSAVLHHSPSTTTTTVEQGAIKNSGKLIGIAATDLACTEEFSYDEYEVSSEFQSEIFSGDSCSVLENFTDEYTPSIWLNSGSQFSEKSFDDSFPSPCFSLFKEFYQQFLKLSSDHHCDHEVSYSDELAYWRFEKEDDEESYRMLRSRERKQVVKVKDYVEEYNFTTEFGGLILEQRLLMVNWIIELSQEKELQSETMFLGVRLFDRFLSNGFFTSRRKLQILGIACLTLATRIEENQPSNRFYLEAATATKEMQRKARYLARLALLDNRQLRFWPSTVADGLVILVSLSTNEDESCQRVVQAHVRTKVDDLPECIKSLEWLVKYA